MMNNNIIKRSILFLFAVILVISSCQISAITIQFDHTHQMIGKDIIENRNKQNPSCNFYNLGWPLIYDHYHEDVSQEIILDSNEHIITTGYTTDNISDEIDFLTLKYNHDGELIWDAVFDYGKYDYAWDIVIDSQDNIIIFGMNSSLEAESISDMNITFYLFKYSPNGDLLWNKSIEIEDDCFPGGITVDSNDNIILTYGKGNFDAMSFFCNTVKIDKDGNELWNTTFTEDMLSIGFEVVVNQDDEIFIGGLGASFFGQGWLIIKYDSSGSLLWTQRFNIGNMLYDLEIDSERNLILTGDHFSLEKNSTRLVTLKCNENGILLWEYTFDSIYSEYGKNAAIDSNGNIVVLGTIFKEDSYEHCIFFLDSQGKEVCMKKPPLDGSFLSMTIDSEDTIFTSGVINVSIDTDNYDSYISKFTDNTPPSIDSYKPQSGYLYLFDSQIVPFFGNTVVIGTITLNAIETSSNDIEKVSFYIDGILKESVEISPYEWVWDEKGFGSYVVEIHVSDEHHNIKRETMTVWKFF